MYMKVSKFAKRRVFVLFVVFAILIIYMSYTIIVYWRQILKNVHEKEELEVLYTELLDEENFLKSDVIKLQDPEYVAKYAREKYLYSKDGELIIKIIDENE